MDFKNAKELLALCEERKLCISDVMRRREIEEGEITGEICDARMKKAYEIMRESARGPIKKPGRSMGGLLGGEAKMLSDWQQGDGQGKSLCGPVLGRAVAYAMAVLETNASMGLIVAAPTAGSSGIVPGVLLALEEQFHFTEAEMIQALYNAGAVGYLAMRNATVAGAVGGCQAEVGVASAMAASAAVELMGSLPKGLSGRGFHSTHELAGSGLRSGGRSGGIPMPESECGRSRCCPYLSRDGAGRRSAADSAGRNDCSHV